MVVVGAFVVGVWPAAAQADDTDPRSLMRSAAIEQAEVAPATASLPVQASPIAHENAEGQKGAAERAAHARGVDAAKVGAHQAGVAAARAAAEGRGPPVAGAPAVTGAAASRAQNANARSAATAEHNGKVRGKPVGAPAPASR